MIVTKLNNSNQTFQEYHEFLDQWNNNVSFVAQQTSGSTGKPKIINIEKVKMKSSAKMTGDFLELTKMLNALLCISPKYIGGKMMIVRALEYNLNLIIAPTSSNPVLELNEKIDFAAMVPLQLQTILNETPEKLDLIHTIIVGGAPVTNELQQSLSRVKTKIYSTFGMTETVSHIALKSLRPSSTLFKAIGSTTFSTSEDNRLIIHAPELKIKALETNDIVKLTDNNSFEWVGRADFVINSGGIKINPEILEEIFTPFIQTEFIIAGIPDNKLGEKVILISEETVDLNQLYEKVKGQIDKYVFPKKNRVAKLVYTKNNKIDRINTKNSVTIEG